jgi:hypothetical protein
MGSNTASLSDHEILISGPALRCAGSCVSTWPLNEWVIGIAKKMGGLDG